MDKPITFKVIRPYDGPINVFAKDGVELFPCSVEAITREEMALRFPDDQFEPGSVIDAHA